jgi:hypothetical protein
MLYFLLIIIAIGVLLISPAGQAILWGIFKFSMICAIITVPPILILMIVGSMNEELGVAFAILCAIFILSKIGHNLGWWNLDKK